jgi:hypothetical protein
LRNEELKEIILVENQTKTVGIIMISALNARMLEEV